MGEPLGTVWRRRGLALKICVCVWACVSACVPSIPRQGKDSCHPSHSSPALGPALPLALCGPTQGRPRCTTVSAVPKNCPAWEKLDGAVPRSALHALLFLPSASRRHTMKTAAAATVSGPSSLHRATLSPVSLSQATVFVHFKKALS